MKKKKKPLINKNITSHYNNLFKQKINYYKIANETSYLLGYLMNTNKQYKLIVNSLIKNNLVSNDQIYPSIVKDFHTNIQIKPFWNNSIQKLSDKLFLPSNDNLCEANDYIKTFNANSWFNVEQYTGFNYKFYKLKTKVNSNDIKKIVKCKQIKLYLNENQRYYMKKIIGTYRYFYNRCVSYLNNYDKTTKTSWFCVEPDNEKTKIAIKVIDNPYNMINMRSQLKSNLPDWLLDKFPSHLIDQAFIEAFNRFKVCLDKCMKTGKPFQFTYKSKKELIHTINLEKVMINSKDNGLFVKWKIDNEYMFKNLNSSEKFNENNIIGSSLSYHKILKTFTLNLNYETLTTTSNSNQICAIDQGIKNPFTIYSPIKVVQIGNGVTRKLYKVCKEIDIIKSRIDKGTYYSKVIVNDIMQKEHYVVNSARKRSLRKALHKKIQYMKNLRNELHNKTIKYLCDTYKTIILPPFKTQEMVGNLTSDIARKMYTLSFYKFKQKLLNKAIEMGVKVHLLNEPFTSKTCGRCGNIKCNLGNADTYVCNKCNLVISRDFNGARNILLRNISQI